MTRFSKSIPEAIGWGSLIVIFGFLSSLFWWWITRDPGVLIYTLVPSLLSLALAHTSVPGGVLGRYLQRATLGLLLLGIYAGPQFAFLTWVAPFVWAGAFLAAFIEYQTRLRDPHNRVGEDDSPPAEPQARSRHSVARSFLVALCLVFAALSVFGRVVYATGFETASVMFIGVPTALAILLVTLARPKSALGAAMAGVTFVLLLSAILFGEGVICIIMAAPIFYIFAAIAAAIVGSKPQKNPESKSNRPPSAMVLLSPLLLMSLEGSTEFLSLARKESVTATRVIAASPSDVEAALAAPLRYPAELPPFLRLEFPRPVSSKGQGLQIGDARIIHFAGGEGHPGDLVMEVAEVTADRVRFHAISDGSKIAHWLKWEDSIVSWRQVDSGHTEVRWTLNYERGVDPSWYFGPWERYAVGLAADYLIESLPASRKALP